MSEGEDAWRPGILIKRHMDLAIMDAKTSNNEYNNLAEFEADAHNILHNIMIYHGSKRFIIYNPMYFFFSKHYISLSCCSSS